ncbi:MAG: diacylglycerol kinase family protein, partial [Bacteroidia bacterium]
MQKSPNLTSSFKYAFNGIRLAFTSNRNLRIHTIFALVVILLCFVLRMSSAEISIIIMVTIIVVAAEMINTAIEEVVDLVTKDYREEAKIAKDVSAGMVLISALGAMIIGVLIFIP